MIDLYLWLSGNFDERYAECQKKYGGKKIPEPFLVDRLESERENLLLINDEAEYQHEIEKWRPLKVVMDAIYKELSPFPKENQTIKIDLTKLNIPENVANSILRALFYERVCRWKDTNSSAVISNVPILEYLNGDGIVVPSYEKFKEFRNEVNDFYKFMEYHRDQKFPKVKAPEISEDFVSTRQHQERALKRTLDKGLEMETITEETLSKLKEDLQINTPNQSLISLKDHEVIFSDTEPLIMVNNIRCEMPPYKSEHYLCRVMFDPKYPLKKAVDWSVVFEEMEGLPQRRRNPKKDMRSVQDTMYAVNKRIRDAIGTTDDLFSWRNKSVVRNH